MSAITDALNAIDVLAERANGEGFRKEDVNGLAGYFKNRSLTFRADAINQVGGVLPYWVGFNIVNISNPDSTPLTTVDRIQFSRTHNMFGAGGNNRRQIQRVFTVPTLRVAVGAAARQLVRSNLDLLSPAPRPKVVITIPLTGCSFAIGVAGNEYFMSHAQPVGGPGERGTDLARAIHGAGAQMFQPGPQAPTSTFLIHPGDTIDESSGFGYGDIEEAHRAANVMGLVVKRTNILGVSYSLSFIVVMSNRHTRYVEKVVVVKHKNSVWKVKEVPN